MNIFLKSILCGTGMLMLSGAVLAQTPQQQKRLEVLQAGARGATGLSVLTAAMKEPDVLLRRAAVRSLGEIGKAALPVLQTALKSDSDDLVRRSALRLLVTLDRGLSDEVLQTGLNDASPLVRVTAVEILAAAKPYSQPTIAALRKAQQDTSTNVSQIAAQALWPYHKEALTVRERPEFKDFQLNILQTIPLPEDGWKFQTDSSQTAHLDEWFKPIFNDSQWKNIAIAKYWEDQGHPNYDGVAWYRRTVELPAKPAGIDGVDLVFEAVDESAWIWVNGQYAGAHDMGAEGWNKRFAADVGDLLKWGEPNQITVRVLDRDKAGGIWKPVYFEVLNHK
jgi:hypothetical protein